MLHKFSYNFYATGQKGGDYHGGSSTSRLDDHLGKCDYMW